MGDIALIHSARDGFEMRSMYTTLGHDTLCDLFCAVHDREDLMEDVPHGTVEFYFGEVIGGRFKTICRHLLLECDVTAGGHDVDLLPATCQIVDCYWSSCPYQ